MLKPFLERAGVPLFQNAPVASAAQAREVPRGDLGIAICASCGFIFNSAFEPELMAYSRSYDNTQSHSPSFENYLTEVADDLIDKHNLRGKQIVEIGCGKGHFLRIICERGNNRGLGFDPAYDGPETSDDGRVRFVRGYLDSLDEVPKADLVCCRHVLEHVPDPLSLLDSARKALGGDGQGVAFFEVPAVEWILRHNAFWDFFYEHNSYFSRQTVEYAFDRSGFDVVSVQALFGGQYLGVEVHPVSPARPAGRADPTELVVEAVQFAKRSGSVVSACCERVVELRKTGRVALWGAGAKGVTLVNLVDPDCELVDCLIDINPAKQGRFVPGTGHPIVGPSDPQARSCVAILMMNPNYADEIRHEVRGWARTGIRTLAV